MAYGGNQVGNNDPARVISGSLMLQEIEPTELLDFYHQHKGTIGGLAVYCALYCNEDPSLASKMSDRLQHHIPTDAAEVVDVIDTLSSNVAFYDRCIEKAIEKHPVAARLKATKDDLPADARSWRMYRSLIAIAHPGTLVSCSGAQETR